MEKEEDEEEGDEPDEGRGWAGSLGGKGKGLPKGFRF